MSLFKVCRLFLVAFVLSACTSVNFNESYDNNSWSSIIVAPNVKDADHYFYDQFTHQLATQNAIKFVMPERVQANLVKLGLEQAYLDSPVDALNEMAKQLNADGFLMVDIEIGQSSLSRTSQSQAKVKTILYAKDSLDIVASTFEDERSLISSSQYCFEQSTYKTLKKLKLAFTKLNPNFDS